MPCQKILSGSKHKRAKKKKKARKAIIKAGRHRPILIKSKSGWKRPKKSRYFKKPIFLKGKHRKSIRPLKKSFKRKVRVAAMDGKKKRSKYYKQVFVMGKKKRHHRARRGLLMGDPGILGRMGNNTLNVAAGVAGGIGGAFVSNLIPAPSKIKALLPVLGGIILASAATIPALKFAGIGLSIIGGLSLVKQYMPGVPVLAGETTIVIPGPQDQRQLGDPVSIGDPVSVAEMGWATSDN